MPELIDGFPDDTTAAFDDPVLFDAAVAIAQSDPVPALKALASSRGDWPRHELYADVLGSAGQDDLLVLTEVADKNPDQPDAWLLLGSAQSCAAASARGAARASQTTEDQFKGMIAYGMEGLESLSRAAALDDSDPVPYSQMLGIVLGTGAEPEVMQGLFDDGVKRCPDLYGLHQFRLSTLCAKWYGEGEQCLEFARSVTEGRGAGDPLWALIPLAHVEMYLYRRGFEGGLLKRALRALRYYDKRVVAELEHASLQLLSPRLDRGSSPQLMSAHQMFAMAFTEAGKPALAEQHFKLAGDRANPWPWGYYGEPREVYLKARGLGRF